MRSFQTSNLQSSWNRIEIAAFHTRFSLQSIVGGEKLSKMTRIVLSWRRIAFPLLTSLFCLAAQSLSLEIRELGEKITKVNKTFECSLSGPCAICSYSEKSDEKYHCSETGYRSTYKCIEVQSDVKEVNREQIVRDSHHVKDANQAGVTNSYQEKQLQNKESHQMDNQIDDTGNKDGNWRRLSETSYSLEDGKQTYHIFRSCVPLSDEENLSVLGFEGIIFVFAANKLPDRLL